ncbi:hypothetical protein GJ496_011003 [Pomphorhynchus laevis]|nr:hypothetical protein GJ496_011003 [Pomphorhynchus laevis]
MRRNSSGFFPPIIPPILPPGIFPSRPPPIFPPVLPPIPPTIYPPCRPNIYPPIIRPTYRYVNVCSCSVTCTRPCGPSCVYYRC